jgi:hypothetical protein
MVVYSTGHCLYNRILRITFLNYDHKTGHRLLAVSSLTRITRFIASLPEFLRSRHQVQPEVHIINELSYPTEQDAF